MKIEFLQKYFVFIGECFTTTCISKYRVASASQCSQRCVQVKTCVGIRYRRTTKPENFCQINCEILKKIERCCSQSENEINDRAWKIYIIPLPTETVSKNIELYTLQNMPPNHSPRPLWKLPQFGGVTLTGALPGLSFRRLW